MWRTFLANQGVEHVSLSYVGLRRRIKDPSKWRLADNYPDNVKIYLDSGAFSYNKDDSDATADEAWQLACAYHAFVRANVDRIEFAAEFDALVFGQEKIYEHRGYFWERDIPAEKWMPIWHSEWGTAALVAMADAYPRVGVVQADSENTDTTPWLKRVAGRTKLHGVAMTQMGLMREIPWDSVGSTSWLGTTQYGETYVWTGRELKRYPKRMKDTARKRHRTWLQGQGFNTDKIDNDDNAELLRLSVWSWRNFAASLERGRAVTINVLSPFGENAEAPPTEVDIPDAGVRNEELAVPPGKKLLPVLGFAFEEQTDADGSKHQIRVMDTPSTGLMRCDSCYIRDKCPAMTAGAECAYEIPVKIRSGTQLAALQDSLIEMQTQRVLQMRMIEQAEGGYADANLSNEMSLLQKMIKTKVEASKEGFSIKLEGTASAAGVGMIGRIFGKDATEKMGALPAGEVTSEEVWEATVVGEE
jgi:hypothetical protein